MYALPVDILLILLDEFSIKDIRLISSTLKNEIQIKYWKNMINVTGTEIKDHIKLNENFFIKKLKYKGSYVHDQYVIDNLEFRVNSKNIVLRTGAEIDFPNTEMNIDIINQYKILSVRFNNDIYIKMIKNKIFDILKFNQLNIYCNSYAVFIDVYIWLVVHCYLITLDSTIITNFIQDYSDIHCRNNIYRSKAKLMYKMLYDYILNL